MHPPFGWSCPRCGTLPPCAGNASKVSTSREQLRELAVCCSERRKFAAQAAPHSSCEESGRSERIRREVGDPASKPAMRIPVPRFAPTTGEQRVQNRPSADEPIAIQEPLYCRRAYRPPFRLELLLPEQALREDLWHQTPDGKRTFDERSPPLSRDPYASAPPSVRYEISRFSTMARRLPLVAQAT